MSETHPMEDQLAEAFTALGQDWGVWKCERLTNHGEEYLACFVEAAKELAGGDDVEAAWEQACQNASDVLDATLRTEWQTVAADRESFPDVVMYGCLVDETGDWRPDDQAWWLKVPGDDGVIGYICVDVLDGRGEHSDSPESCFGVFSWRPIPEDDADQYEATSREPMKDSSSLIGKVDEGWAWTAPGDLSKTIEAAIDKLRA